MIEFIAGAILGAVFGVFCISLLTVSKMADEREEQFFEGKENEDV